MSSMGRKSIWGERDRLCATACKLEYCFSGLVVVSGTRYLVESPGSDILKEKW